MTHSISALFISLLASLALLAMPAPSFASPAVLGTRKPAPVQAKAPVPAAPAQPAAGCFSNSPRCTGSGAPASGRPRHHSDPQRCRGLHPGHGGKFRL